MGLNRDSRAVVSEDCEVIALDGVVERVTFHNAENGFCVLRIKAVGHMDLVTVVGSVPAIVEGETVSVSGRWNSDGKYGLQLQASSLSVVLPSTVEGLRKYLGSGLIKGIGPHFAKKIVDHFGVAAMDIIESAPHRMGEIAGIGAGRIETISRSWTENRVIRDVMIFLQGHSVSAVLASKIFRHYGAGALDVVKNDPYRLVRDISGVGFLSADKIALNIGIPQDSPQRVRAALSYVLQEAATSGHCALPELVLLNKTERMLSVERDILVNALRDEIREKRLIPVMVEGGDGDGNRSPNGVDAVDAHICDECSVKEVREQRLIFLPPYLHYERYIAQKITKIKSGEHAIGAGLCFDSAIMWLRARYRINLSETQRDALANVLRSKFSVITGGPGTGKTTLVNSIVKIVTLYDGMNQSNAHEMKDTCNCLQHKIRVKLAAPTGRAAKRLSESTRHYATTIHRLLEFDPQTNGFKYNESKPLACDLLIVDESSMIDVYLMFSLLKAVTQETTVILVGDVDQIPSIGPGQILCDVIKSNVVSTTQLNKIFRQAANSKIIINAHLVNKGMMPKLLHNGPGMLYTQCMETTHQSMSKSVVQGGDKDGCEKGQFGTPQSINESLATDFIFYEAHDAQDALDNVIRILQYDLPTLFSTRDSTVRSCGTPRCSSLFDMKRDVQVLSPMQKGTVGARAINSALQKILNPASVSDHIEAYGQCYAISDKVMQVENNYSKLVFNGDIGYIKSINREERIVIVDFEENEVQYEFHELDQLMLAYAVTIHKSQGSEYPVVIITLLTQHFVMLNKNLLYTAITRGKNLVVLVGQKNAVAMAVHNNSACERHTMLRNWLIAGDSGYCL